MMALTRLCRGHLHYAWVVLGVMFSATLAGVGVRAAPGVMIVPLQHAFGWNVATISGAVSLNIILLGFDRSVFDRADRICRSQTHDHRLHVDPDRRHRAVELDDEPMAVVSDLGVDGRDRLLALVRSAWRRRSPTAGLSSVTASRWGLLTAANAAGQLIFLPVLALLAQRYGWRGVSVTVTVRGRGDGPGRHAGDAGMAIRHRRRSVRRGAGYGTTAASWQQSGCSGIADLGSCLAVDRFLAVDRQLRSLRPVDERADQHPSDRLLRRPWHFGIGRVRTSWRRLVSLA